MCVCVSRPVSQCLSVSQPVSVSVHAEPELSSCGSVCRALAEQVRTVRARVLLAAGHRGALSDVRVSLGAPCWCPLPSAPPMITWPRAPQEPGRTQLAPCGTHSQAGRDPGAPLPWEARSVSSPVPDGVAAAWALPSAQRGRLGEAAGGGQGRGERGVCGPQS